MNQSLSIILSLGLSAVLGITGQQLSANLAPKPEIDSRFIGDANVQLPILDLASDTTVNAEVKASTAQPSPTPAASVMPSPAASVAPSVNPNPSPAGSASPVASAQPAASGQPAASASPIAQASAAPAASAQVSASPTPAASAPSTAAVSANTETELKLPIEVKLGNSNILGISLGL